ncbi:MAG: UDP-N-acetylmuramoyl-tripeptide--D-alanyl-D-alanine ligase [Rickettsiales bacterium]|nr:UDP-N-acetylmuramoyl-tripeptide--D-alanyl-D-alanine ligase [Pseudomonadota bacterium]MDA0966133.1 UDP-N-acetylmuramoyl-tripeptide--D-alanyl-D-alanine ligase [Pseudomonadota bacterium]MDG4543202.1 UDP-N-acetylmuramoyl-tripeptide--D-alanyl-D-alanine ligase [Rickettsiales bacterium]MDG4545400.1 UDP-N-acetylmuramoyl-tripeptide--D-alanyl-D-alanine ligase [Rickettsiales bacterium]MDG4547849.1 UDP-N-acetylmuramoyl-tripeptide--D-alanyl-D-alanine ligase [Rickettsiales bacterium]
MKLIAEKNNMTLWSSEDVQTATGGVSVNSWEATGVSIDSRKIESGDLFIALVGDNNDGHKYVKSALEKGACAAVVNYVPDDLDDRDNLLIVDNTFDALWDMARYSRDRMKGKVIMVTGSVGKTTTKEMLAHVLEHQGKVHATIGNLNNHYGLPLTLARMPADTDYAVLEVGMSSAGEISPLSVLAQPDSVIITNVEPVHLEFFDSIEGIAKAKAEVFDGLKEGGFAVLNYDNLNFPYLQKIADEKNIKNIKTFGKSGGADFRLNNYEEAANNANIMASLDGSEVRYEIGIFGEHHALNSLGVLALVKSVSANLERAADAFADFEAKAGRGKRMCIEGKFGNITLIDDTYNASPAAVSASLKVLGDIKAKYNNRIVAVLGDMFELGDDAIKMHEELSKKIIENNVDVVFTAGKLTKSLYNRLPDEIKGNHKDDSSEIAISVYNCLKDGDVVLVKGSRGMKMENVVNYICNDKGMKNAI